MRITLVTLGSVGDVYPFVALGQGLQAAGHAVLIVTHPTFETTIHSRGLGFAPVAIDPRALLEDEGGQSWLDSGGNGLRFFRQFSRLAETLVRQTTTDCWNACQGADAILFSTIAFCIAYPIAEKLGVPSAWTATYPLTPTRAFANVFFPAAPDWLPFGEGYYNRLTHSLALQTFWQLLRPTVNRVLPEFLGSPRFSWQWLLQQLRQERITMLYGYSPSLVPPPPDWSSKNHVTGFWPLQRQADWQPPDELVDFLASGPAPVYIGFGSMHDRNPQEVTAMVVKALALAKQRGILMTGWGAMSRMNLPDDVFMIDAIPHDWLFPQMAAVVHHGGPGTLGMALRAGIPVVVVPFFGDQPFWGHRVYKLGIGPRPVPRKHLSAERLAAAITSAVSDSAIRKRATALGVSIRAEDGVAGAVEVLERYLGR